MPKLTIADGTQINNGAEVYFDQNDVVVTNNTLNTVRNNPVPDARFKESASCTNTQSYDFTYTGSTPDNSTFAWQFGPDATPSTSNVQNPSGIVFSSTGYKYATLTLTHFGCIGIITDTFNVVTAACGNNKVMVCHNGHSICISVNALPAHLAQGYCLGNCNTSFSSRIAAIPDEEKIISEEIALSLAPNPITESSVLSFSIPEDDYVEINMYNYLGETTRNLFAGQVKGNINQIVTISAKEFPQGIYFLTLRTSKDIKNIKFILKK